MPLLAISLISAGAIACEIIFMRLFSIVQWHHFAFLIISAALLGYGASGTFLSFARTFLTAHFAAAFRINAILFGIFAYGGFALAQRLNFNPLELAWAPSQLLLLGATYGLLLPPFFFAANCIGLCFSRFGKRIGAIYCADLSGAGLGALAAILSMTILPAETALIGAAASGFLAAGCAFFDRQTPLWIAAAALALLAPRAFVEPQLSEYKGLRAALLAPGARIVAERHSPLGRIEVVESLQAPFRHAPGLSLASQHTPPEQLGVFIDGEGPQPITRFTGDLASLAYLDDTTEAAPYHARRPARVLVLGAGTGAAVLLARHHRAAHVDAVEGDPALANLMRTRFADYAGRLYDRPPVAFHAVEPRSFVAGARTRYDLICVPLSASRGSIMSGLKEAYVFTTEALGAYLDHLAPGGMVAITREVKNPPRDSHKLFASAIDALAARGIADPGRNLVLVHGWQTFTLIIKNEPFDDSEIESLRGFLAARFFDAGYYPGMRRAEANRYNMLDAPYFFDGSAALLSADRRRFIADYKFNIEPATDDRPFFDNFFKWSALSEQLALHRDAGLPLMERGYVILLAALAQAAFFAFVLIVAPLGALRGAAGAGLGERARVLIYFTALGLAFLFIEIVFMQRFTLFFGHPLYAISVVLAAFLIFAGIGAALSERAAALIQERLPTSPLYVIAAAIGLLSVVYLAFLPAVFAWLMPLAAPFKAIVASALIAPLAFFMGMPFPLGLARLSAHAPALVPWAWGVNGCASVISPILALLFSLHWGFNAVILVAVALYLSAAAVWRRVST